MNLHYKGLLNLGGEKFKGKAGCIIVSCTTLRGVLPVLIAGIPIGQTNGCIIRLLGKYHYQTGLENKTLKLLP